MENKKLTNPIMIRSGEITPLAIAAISTMGCINKPSNKGNRYQILIVPRMPAISMNRILDPNPLATAKNESEIQKKLTISREKAIELLFNKTGEKHYSEIIVDQMIKDNTLGSYDFFIVNIDQYIQKINKMKSDNKTRNNKSTNNKSRNNKSRNNNNVPKRTGLSSDKLLQRLKNEEKYRKM